MLFSGEAALLSTMHPELESLFMEMKKSYAKINEDSVRNIEKESIDREKQMHDWWFDNDDPLLTGRIKEIEGSTAWNHRYLQHSTLVQVRVYYLLFIDL